MKTDSRERLGLSFTIDYLLYNKGVNQTEEEPSRHPTIEQAMLNNLSTHQDPKYKEVGTSRQNDMIQCSNLDTIKRNTNEKKDTKEEEEEHTTTSSYSNKSEEKPNQSYIALISKAILASQQKKLLLCDIYQWIMDHYPYFKSKDKNWRNSVRHNLSLNECFIKAGRSDNGKGHFWAIHPSNYHDFSKGDYHCRRARRRVRRLAGQVPLSASYHPLFGPRQPVCWCCPRSPTLTCLPTRLCWPWSHLQPHVGMYPLFQTSTS
ncbi:LOW QUALITY PROTEIN: forkhead box Q2 [Boleophthalmus pectinirostris]|uniref:LOW QUALITY PROTEIN: forkhead box Q2 n=1 Tax=Boleophthalmus pectinirostris TaxID=150288 RepID=UPI00242CC6FB|nr:LOW QUALITY PROTEIN: forkhead box Q2 [Boleophthalmus pectinirostris]